MKRGLPQMIKGKIPVKRKMWRIIIGEQGGLGAVFPDDLPHANTPLLPTQAFYNRSNTTQTLLNLKLPSFYFWA